MTSKVVHVIHAVAIRPVYIILSLCSCQCPKHPDLAHDRKFQGCRGYGYPWIYPWIYPCVDIRLRQYPWIFMDTNGYFYVTALELATSQNHNKTKQNRLFVGQLVLVLQRGRIEEGP